MNTGIHRIGLQPNASIQQQNIVGSFPMGTGVIPIPIYVYNPPLAIPISKLESYDHSHGITVGFLFLLRIEFPWSSLRRSTIAIDTGGGGKRRQFKRGPARELKYGFHFHAVILFQHTHF